MTQLRTTTSGGLSLIRKKRNNLFFGLVIAVYLSLPTFVFSSQIVIDSGEQFQFALALMEEGKFDQAVAEFERYIHFFPEDSNVLMARQFMGICHIKNGSHEKARKVFSQIIELDPEGPLAIRALFLIGESYYLQGALKEAEHYFLEIIRKYPRSDLKNAALYRLGWTKLYADSWRDASQIFFKVEEEKPNYLNAKELAQKSIGGEALNYKVPGYAGGLSAIVPGMGHAYVGRYKDAIVAFLLNGLFIWAAVESFRQDHDVLGGILVFMEAGWYTGTIYSSVNAAHKYNRKVNRGFRKRLQDRIDLGLLASKEGHLGLTLSFKF